MNVRPAQADYVPEQLRGSLQHFFNRQSFHCNDDGQVLNFVLEPESLFSWLVRTSGGGDLVSRVHSILGLISKTYFVFARRNGPNEELCSSLTVSVNWMTLIFRSLCFFDLLGSHSFRSNLS